MQEVARVRPVIKRLKETGWYFASHSYGHIRLAVVSLDSVKKDALRWMDEVASLIGETKILIYPHGERLDNGDVYSTGPALLFYNDLGFRIFASVGNESFSRIKPDIPAVVCDRMHADGISLRGERERYMKFYDAAKVFDPLRPTAYGTKW
jgi:peptidoglycan/xylan/chitin deacetylase (PgdA/CDA1 family)